jgi:thiamine-monophosphate kinase
MSKAKDEKTSHVQLGDGREFDTIRDFVKRWGDAAVGIGDDAATLDLPRGERLVVSVDSLVAGRHFEPAWITPREIGYRATAAALNDLAAMAALPLGILFAINVPDSWRDKLGEIADGVADAALGAGTTIRGGNIAAGVELSITTTVLGHAFEPLTRRGAAVGDRVYVTGRLGGPGAAVAAWRAGAKPTAIARGRFAHPIPRIHEARWLANNGATACIDISDGVVADARHIAAASGRNIEMHLDRLPLIDGVRSADAARSGEEYELLVTAPRLDVDAFTAAFGLPLTEIGSVLAGEPGVTTLEHGARVAAVAGHDHFSK